MEKLFFEDYEIGEVFESPGRTITETDLVLFSAFTGDWHPVHTNIEYAAKSSFKERIERNALQGRFYIRIRLAAEENIATV